MQKLNSIPAELRERRQWVVWRYENRGGPKPTKVPYNPMTAYKAVVTKPETWVSFDEAVYALNNGGQYNGIGFVLSKDDPYAFIDLDDTKGDERQTAIQTKIFNEFQSYSERSPSGKGLHILVKGGIVNGRRRGSIEVYSEDRYMTMTGDVFNNSPIAQNQEKLTRLWVELGGREVENGAFIDKPQTDVDAQIVKMALNAANGEKANSLWRGDWQHLYSSQSEADFALIDIFAYYTQNREQIIRLFRLSGLGQRPKAYRDDYVTRMVNRSFDRLPVDVELTGMDAAYKKAIEQQATNEVISEQPQKKAAEFKLPRGILGEITKFIFQASPRPVQEVALLGAIGLLAGICGRAWNISGTGLNQYLMLLAPTGTGKEGMASGIDKLLASIRINCPASADFRGPSGMASGQALINHLGRTPCLVSLIGEFGLMLQRLANPRKSSSEIILKQVLLDLYSKSGHGQTLQSTIYADKAKNTKVINSPSLTLLGESTPESLYEAVDEALIADGLMPRFLILEYDGPRPFRNDYHTQAVPTIELCTQLETLCTHSLTMMQREVVLNVTTDPDAVNYLDDIDRMTTNKMNESGQEVVKQLWNRVHLKTLRLAALVAVGANPTAPVICLDDALWAYSIVSANVEKLIHRFDTGQIGNMLSESAQMDDMVNAIKRYLKDSAHSLRIYGVIPDMHRDKVVNYGVLHRLLAPRAAFRKDRMGATIAIKRTISILIESGDLTELGGHAIANKYPNKRGKVYAITNFERFT